MPELWLEQPVLVQEPVQVPELGLEQPVLVQEPVRQVLVAVPEQGQLVRLVQVQVLEQVARLELVDRQLVPVWPLQYRLGSAE